MLTGFPGGASGKEPIGQCRRPSVPGSGRSPGEGNGNPLQYSCLENPMDRGAWWTTVHRAAKSQTRLKGLSTHPEKPFLGEGKSPSLLPYRNLLLLILVISPHRIYHFRTFYNPFTLSPSLDRMVHCEGCSFAHSVHWCFLTVQNSDVQWWCFKMFLVE